MSGKSPTEFISDITRFSQSHEDVQVVDQISPEVVDDIIMARYGKTRFEDPEIRELSSDMLNDPSYGNWVYFPWRNQALRYPKADDYYAVRTSRNRQLITEEEQDILRAKKIASIGESVGSSIALEAVRLGIGSEYILADFDTISVSNLNRIRANLGDVGLKKVEWVGREIALIDPYITQIHVNEGYSEDMNKLMDQVHPDVIVEEVDNLQAKAQIRQYARDERIPLVSVGDFAKNSVVETELYHLEDAKPFNGRLSEDKFAALRDGALSEEQVKSAMVKIVGPKNVSPRLLESLSDPDLDGLPQLTTTVGIGAGLGVAAIAGIFLERVKSSGTYKVNQDKVLKLKPEQSLQSAARTWLKFITQKKP